MSALNFHESKVIAALGALADVEKCLVFLARHGVIKEDSVVKGCRKFVKDHPEIQAWIDSDTFKDDITK